MFQLQMDRQKHYGRFLRVGKRATAVAAAAAAAADDASIMSTVEVVWAPGQAMLAITKLVLSHESGLCMSQGAWMSCVISE